MDRFRKYKKLNSRDSNISDDHIGDKGNNICKKVSKNES